MFSNVRPRSFTKIILLSYILLLFGYSSFTNGSEKTLFDNATHYINSATIEAENYSMALQSYKDAQKVIDITLSEYSSSNIAVDIKSSRRLISGFTLNEFQALESQLKLLAEAEQEPLSCALLLVNTFNRIESKAEAMEYISKSYFKAGKFLQAIETANKIVYNSWKNILFNEYVYDLVESGKITLALKIVDEMDNENYKKAYSLTEVAAKYISLGQHEKANQILSEALKVAEHIEYESEKYYSLLKIADEYFNAGVKKKADEIYSQVINATLKMEDIKEKDKFLADIAYYFTKTGQLVEALKITDIIEDKESNVRLVADIAVKYGEGGQNEKSTFYFDKALNMAETMTELKHELFFDIVTRLAEAGQFARALITVNKIDDIDYRTRALIKICTKFVDIGELEKARYTAKIIEPDREKNEVFTTIATKHIQAGKLNNAINIAEEMKDLEWGSYKSEIYLQIINGQIKSGQLIDAHKLTEKIFDKYYKAKAMVEIADKYLHSKNKEMACKLISQTLVIAEKDYDQNSKAEAMFDIALIFAKANQNEKASEIVLKTLEEMSTSSFYFFKENKSLIDIAENFIEAGKKEIAIQILSYKYREVMATDNINYDRISRLATMYAKAGQAHMNSKIYSQMLEKVKTSNDKMDTIRFLADTGLDYFIRGHQPSEKEREGLRQIVQQAYPIKLFWKRGMSGIADQSMNK
jgi:tetratricopeptide (TPR) repeat protein